MRLPTGVQALPTSGPFPPPLSHAFITPLNTHSGHGSVRLPVTYTRDESGRLTLEVPAARLPVPPASVWITLIGHVVSTPPAKGFGIGNGGPKKQLASSAQEPDSPPQSASVVQEAPGFVAATQCFPGPAPWVQLSGPLPGLATRLPPEMAK